MKKKQKQTSWPELLIMGIFVVILALLIIFSPQLGKNCKVQIEEAINQSFINGTTYALEYAVASITSEAIQCNQIPVSYQNYSYTLIALECLDLNKKEEN